MLKKVGPPLRLELSEEHARWLEGERKIPSEIAAAMGIVSDGKRLVFEYRRTDRLLWLQYRFVEKAADGSLNKTFRCYAPDGKTTISEAGIGLLFWNEDELCDPSNPEIPRIITEGQFDAASFKVAGCPYVGSVPNGAVDHMGQGDIVPSEDTQFAYLWEDGKLRAGLDTAQQIILATDSDKAGRVLREELALRLGRDRCWYVTYPDGCKDANEVLVKFGQDKGSDILNEMVADAQPIVPSRLVKYSRVPVVKREYLHSGWADLNSHLKVTRPELMVITGPPGHGKTQFALALGANLAHCHGWRGAILQFEDDVERNREDLTRFWLTNHGGGDPREASPERRAEAAAWIDQGFCTIAPDESVGDTIFDLSWLKRTVAEAAIRHHCRWLLIDPWNEIEHLWGKGQTENQYLNDALREMKRLGRRYQLAIIIVTHPDKGSGRVRDIDEWDLYSVSGGQTWNNKADHGIVVLRPDKNDPTTFVKVCKSKRHAYMGLPGTVRMQFMPLKGTFDFIGKHE